MFPDDRFWNLGYPTGSAELAVNWSHGKNWQVLVFKELNFLFKVFLGKLKKKIGRKPCGTKDSGAVTDDSDRTDAKGSQQLHMCWCWVRNKKTEGAGREVCFVLSACHLHLVEERG